MLTGERLDILLQSPTVAGDVELAHGSRRYDLPPDVEPSTAHLKAGGISRLHLIAADARHRRENGMPAGRRRLTGRLRYTPWQRAVAGQRPNRALALPCLGKDSSSPRTDFVISSALAPCAKRPAYSPSGPSSSTEAV